MIILDLEIEDFKQFHGKHHFRPGPDGVVAIIGQNGAGKTTLFKAIEWCLYQPSELKNKEITTRGKGGIPRVKLTLQRPTDGMVFVVERRLKRSGKSAEAEVYRLDQPESRIVEGPKEVREYITRSLIGLDHAAFVATFFTRQKELGFFSTMGATERREKVGKMLGTQAVKIAQEMIRDERKDVRAAASTKTRDAEAQLAARDWEGEIAAATTDAEAAATAVAGATSRAEAQRQAVVAAEAAESAEAQREREDRDLAGRIAQAASDMGRAEERQLKADQDLAVIADAEKQLVGVRTAAATLPQAEVRIAEFEAAQQKAARLDQLSGQLRVAETDLDTIAAKVGDAVTAIAAPDLPGWSWTVADRKDLVGGIRRLLHAADGVDAAAAQQRLQALEAIRGAEGIVQEKAKHLETCLRTLDSVDQQIAELLSAGDPESAVQDIVREKDLVGREIATQEAERTSLRNALTQPTELIARLREQDVAEPCPSCGRPFDADGIAMMIASLTATLDGLHRDIADRDAAIDRLKRAETDAAARFARETQRKEALAALRNRRENGTTKTSEAELDRDQASQVLDEKLAAAGLVKVPLEADVEVARQAAQRAQRIGQVAGQLRAERDAAERALRDHTTAADAIKDIGAVTYDASGHEDARRLLDAVKEAQILEAKLATEVARREAVEADRAAAVAESEAAIALRDATEATRRALAFDLRALEERRTALEQARVTEREALKAVGDARLEAQQRANELQRIVEERDRLRRMLAEAGDLIRRAEELDEMDKQFTNFERYVAAQIAPRLSDLTSEMVRAITEDKYDRVEFDDDYGIRVFDGPDESFPLEEFSGGERDVISLSARLALSELIGEQAANPPGFLVLDEVFGALDRDRRAQTLETLGNLADAANVFRQMFVISHVDDVRQSPLFDEVWRVVEGKDGVSTLESLNETQGLEEA